MALTSSLDGGLDSDEGEQAQKIINDKLVIMYSFFMFKIEFWVKSNLIFIGSKVNRRE